MLSNKIRTVAHEMIVSEKIIKNVVKIDLKTKCLKIRTLQHLTDFQKIPSLTRVNFNLKKLLAGIDTFEFIFSDEKIFTYEATCKRQNDLALADICDFRKHCVMQYAAI